MLKELYKYIDVITKEINLLQIKKDLETDDNTKQHLRDKLINLNHILFHLNEAISYINFGKECLGK